MQILSWKNLIKGKIFPRKIVVVGLLLGTSWFAPLVKANSVWFLEMKHFQNSARTLAFDVYPGHGVNIVFTQAQMKAKVVWLDDMSRIGLSFDGVLCEKWVDKSCTASNKNGASVIHLTLHKDIFQVCYHQSDLVEPLTLQEQLECDPKEKSLTGKTSLSILLEGANGESQFIVVDINPRPLEVAPSNRVNTIFVNRNSSSTFYLGGNSVDLNDATPDAIEAQDKRLEQINSASQQEKLSTKEKTTNQTEN